MKKIAGATLIWLIVLLTANISLADIIYNQYGWPVAGNNPFCYEGAFVAQDFTVNGNWLLTNLTFNALTTDVTEPLTDIYVNIYTNNSGSPGTLLFDNHIVGTFAGVVIGSLPDYTIREYEVTLPGQALTTGTYWLALKAEQPQYNMHWSMPTFEQIGLRSWSSFDGSSWNIYYQEHCFRLESNPVPIPPAVWLFGSGVAGLVGLRRLRRR